MRFATVTQATNQKNLPPIGITDYSTHQMSNPMIILLVLLVLVFAFGSRLLKEA